MMTVKRKGHGVSNKLHLFLEEMEKLFLFFRE